VQDFVHQQYDHPLRLEWSRSMGFQSPRWLTQYLRQGCVMINTLLSFCPHFAIMLLFYNNKYGLRKYNILPIQHLKDWKCNSHLPKPKTWQAASVPRVVTSGENRGRSEVWVDCRLPRELVNRVWGNISSYRWCNHCEQTCRNMFEDSLGLNGMQIYRLVRSCSIASKYSKAIPHLCKYTVYYSITSYGCFQK